MLNNDPKWHKLFSKARKLEKLNAVFKEIIKLDLREHCSLAKIESEQLFLTVDCAAWATKLHYSLSDLLKNLRIQPEFRQITKIRYSVANSALVSGRHQPQNAKKPKALSNNSADLLKNAAANIKNAHLREALLRLARNSEL